MRRAKPGRRTKDPFFSLLTSVARPPTRPQYATYLPLQARGERVVDLQTARVSARASGDTGRDPPGGCV